MTWEYLIGSEKDFEGAPDWCTHVTRSTGNGELCWEMDSITKSGNKYQWADVEREPHFYGYTTGTKLNVVAQRRKRESTEWNGEGLPPVGCVCEALITGEWKRVKVAFSGDDLELNASGEFVVIDLENTHLSWADEFRPLRTKEQIEREETVKSMVYFLEYAPFISWEDIAGRIFDAGYRKTK